jgi:hypothetical protein
VRACGHLLHMNCYQRHFTSVMGRGRQELRDIGLDVRRGEFLCPLCSSLCNNVVPVATTTTTAAAPVVALDTISNWSLQVEQWMAGQDPTTTTDTSHRALSIVQMRVGTLLWDYPLPSESSSLLWDAAIAAAFCRGKKEFQWFQFGIFE